MEVPVISGLVQLARYVASGVGSITTTMLAGWRASKEGQARLISAQFDSKVRLIEAETEAEVIEIMTETHVSTLQSTNQDVESGQGRLEVDYADITQSLQYQTYKRIANTSSVVETAADSLVGKEVEAHDPDPDWTARAFGYIQDVSSEDLRGMWASVLSGEVENPGQTSLRTLDILRNITQRDAELFKTLCAYTMRGQWVFYGDEAKNITALGYNNLLLLQDAGLVDLSFNLNVSIPVDTKTYIANIHQGVGLLIEIDQDRNTSLSIPSFRLTSAGSELSKIVERTTEPEYLLMLAKYLESQNCSLYRLEGVVENPDEETIAFSNKIPIRA